MGKQRLVLTAVTVYKGIIQVIMPNGSIALYAQRGVGELTLDEAVVAIERDIIRPDAFNLPELPTNIDISFEDPSIQGRALAKFDRSILYDS